MLALLLLLISSLSLNFYFYYQIFSISHRKLGVEPGWSQQAAAEAEAVAALSCSGHGRAFLDSIIIDGAPKCECNTCYVGHNCSVLLPNCSANAARFDLLECKITFLNFNTVIKTFENDIKWDFFFVKSVAILCFWSHIGSNMQRTVQS